MYSNGYSNLTNKISKSSRLPTLEEKVVQAEKS
jgi:hypothetical protein